jgi:F-type H+-transporting ATPase subunit delta
MSGMAVAVKRYAKALFQVARDHEMVDSIGSQLAAISQAVESHASIRNFLEHPNVDASVKVSLIKQAVGEHLSQYVLKLLQLLIERGRASAISGVYGAFVSIADEALGRAHAYVTSAFPLSTQQQQEIIARFSNITGKEMSLETEVDSSLLGGIRVRIGDTMYDGSLATKLATLEKSFNKAR